MKPWERWTFNALSLIVSVTGFSYLWMKYALQTDDPFAVVNHPWQTSLLSLHVIASPAFILIFGIVFNSHVMKKLGATRLPNRRSGFISLFTFAVMVVSGYLLQVSSNEGWLTTLVVAHISSGAVFSIAYATHLVISARLIRAQHLMGCDRDRCLGRVVPLTKSAMKTVALFVLTGFVALSADNTPLVFVSRDVYLMGTRAQLSTFAVTHNNGLASLETALNVIEDTEEELSTWRQSSQISALNRHPVGKPWTATPRLCRMFVDLWAWHRATNGAFDPTLGQLLTAWDIHGKGAIPAPEIHPRALASSGLTLLAFDRSGCTLTKRADVAMDVGAFGKGEALDRAAKVLRYGPWMIDIGGQITVGGPLPHGGAWPIDIADPRQRDHPALQVEMTAGSLSTSAGSERDLVVDGERVGHILDPRTGHPVTFDGSVTVWHERGMAADTLSTALYVMGPEEGLRWAEARGIAACYLIPEEQGALRVEMTHAFHRLLP